MSNPLRDEIIRIMREEKVLSGIDINKLVDNKYKEHTGAALYELHRMKKEGLVEQVVEFTSSDILTSYKLSGDL